MPAIYAKRGYRAFISTPLHVACAAGHQEIVQELLNHKSIDVDARDGDGKTTLYLATEAGHATIVELLLNCPGLSETDMAVGIATKKGHGKILDLLINSGKVLVDKAESRHALFTAVENGQSKQVQSLLASGADPNSKDDKEGYPILRKALDVADPVAKRAIMESLLKNGAMVDSADQQGYTALHWACDAGDTDTAALLLQHGASPDKEDLLGEPLLTLPTNEVNLKPSSFSLSNLPPVKPTQSPNLHPSRRPRLRRRTKNN